MGKLHLDVINNKDYPLLIRIYFFSNKIFQELLILLKSCLTGFWLGILKREDLHLIDKSYYDGKWYCKDDYNSLGLFHWEQKAINKYFQNRKCLLVIGAGGGREVLALCKLGYNVDGFECNPKLLEYANKFLNKEGTIANIQPAPRDWCPHTNKIYDGAIIGWGSYAHIMGQSQRIYFLNELRSHLQEGSPILVSSPFNSCLSRRFKIITVIGNIIRWALRREYLQIGDDIFDTVYVHFFTKEQIVSELNEGGFKLEFLGFYNYGHAVGIAI